MNLSFIWHMHQPDYRDNSGVMQMPWVFLHAIKDYYDMPWMLERHGDLKATFNITPPLITQLKLYFSNPQENDKFLGLWLKDLNILNENERSWMIKICKSTPFDTMVSPIKTYSKLYKKEHFNDSELFDLQVLFVLSWCGVYLKTNSDLIKSLLEKGRDYSYKDKELLLSELSSFISGIFDYYKKLHSQNLISISTTPLNHPILPLLIDMKNAKKANPSTNIPKEIISLEDDANLQIKRAIELFEETFEFTPQGFWPAEGAVDEKSVNMLKDHGIKWIATDEAILFRSLNDSNRTHLYKPYNFNGVCIGFRDHSLSDNIGFTYRYWNANRASEHFMSSLAQINALDEQSTVFVILDGENAWEFFPNNGFDFFDSLYSDIKNTPWCNMVHMEDVVGFQSVSLQNLSAGSWIHGEFNTWVGHSEKTRGWELIYLTKKDYEHHKQNLSEETKEKITKHFLAAECSDWFWWYGDDHYTEFGVEFDQLFREHLLSVYNLMNVSAPSDLYEPIIKDRSLKDFLIKPQSHISPSINGYHDSFFEWVGCGVVDESKMFSTMDKVRGPIKKILYGQDEDYLYFALEHKEQNSTADCDGLNVFIEPIGFVSKVEFSGKQSEDSKDISIKLVSKKWIEFMVDKKNIDAQEIRIRFELFKDEQIVQSLPGFGELEISLKTDYSENWFV